MIWGLMAWGLNGQAESRLTVRGGGPFCLLCLPSHRSATHTRFSAQYRIPMKSGQFFSVVSPPDVAGAGTPFEAPSFSPEPNGFTSVTPSPLRSSPTPCPPSGLLGESLRLLCWPGNQGDVSLLKFPRQHVLLGDGVTAKHTHTHTHACTRTMVKKRRKYSLFAIGLIRASNTVTAPGTL